MNAAGVVASIIDAHAFMAARGASISSSLVDNLVTQIAVQIASLATFTIGDATAITDAVKGSPFGEKAHMISEAVDTRLGSSSPAAKDKTTTKTQHLYSFNLYATQADWDVFRNPDLTLHIKMEQAAARLNRYGCCNPDPQTSKRVVALLVLSHFAETPSHSELHKYVKDFKDVCKANRRPYPLAPIRTYPTSPMELPKAVRDLAWSPDDPPVHVEVRGFNDLVQNHIALRNNSRLIKKGKKKREDDSLTWDDVRGLLVGAERPNIRFSDRDGHPAPAYGLGARQQLAIENQPAASEERIVIRGSSGIMPKSPNALVAISGAAVRQRECDGGAPGGDAEPAEGDVAKAKAADDDWDDEPSRPTRKRPAAAVAAVGDVAGLSEYEQAALAALQLREDKKKAEKAKEKAEKAKAEAAEKALKAKAAQAAGKGAKMKRPAAAGITHAHTPVTTASPVPKPTAGGQAPGPREYHGGRVYYSTSKGGFRVIRDASNMSTERFIKFKGSTPSKDEWMAALRCIDDFHSK